MENRPNSPLSGSETNSDYGETHIVTSRPMSKPDSFHSASSSLTNNDSNTSLNSPINRRFRINSIRPHTPANDVRNQSSSPLTTPVPRDPSRSVSPCNVMDRSIDLQLHSTTIDTTTGDNAEDTQDTQNDLIIASSQNQAVVLELDLDCNVRFLGKTWETIVGTRVSKIKGKNISNIIVGEQEDKEVFKKATAIMMEDDESYRVKFIVHTNSANISRVTTATESHISSFVDSSLGNSTMDQAEPDPEDDSDSLSTHSTNSSLSTDGDFIELEAQGILIHEQNSRDPTHTMWIVKPFVPLKDITLELPEDLRMSLGFGVNLFESYLLHLMDLTIIDEDNIPPPPQELCRICEQHVPNWWLERHTEICLVEHRTEDIEIGFKRS
ncbi:unnamed protein product [Ambrosiozyma monospora]|uniref:Unnamed protein product n=1 Tax=Ambrosiozyma monospora TaxID=43982 RepID=A0ACB5TEN4_AMBMO|nr:unnamed protein product [Ambrosiozyma monospora]